MPDEETQVETPAEEQQEIVLEEAGSAEEKEEILDPGQNEGKKKVETPIDDPNHPRFQQVYAKWKGAERKIGEFEEKLNANEAVMSEVRKHNAALMDKIEALSNKAIDAVENVRQPAGEPPVIVSAKKAIADLEARKEEAVENLKGKEVVQIDRELRKLERVIEGYEYHVSQQNEAKRREKEQTKVQKQAQQVDPDIESFQNDTKEWFNKDPIMTGAAKEYDLFLSQQPEWQGKPFGERLKKVKEEIETRFGPKEKPKPKTSGAESGLGLHRAPSSGSRTVKLSEAQLSVAKGLGVSPEDYAKQLNFLGGAI